MENGTKKTYGVTVHHMERLALKKVCKKNIRDIEWDDVSEYAPAVLAAVIMPLTFSIAYGIAIGFIAYVLIKSLSGKQSQLNKGSIAIAAVSLLYFAV